MSLWRHESSSCRKPRLSTEHCCRLHTLAIFCRPPGPASAAAPRTPSRVARGRARTLGLGVAPPAGGGAGARLRSPLRGPGAARSPSRPPGVPARQLCVPRPGSPGTASSYAGARSPRRPCSPARPRRLRPCPGLLGFKLVPSLPAYRPTPTVASSAPLLLVTSRSKLPLPGAPGKSRNRNKCPDAFGGTEPRGFQR